MHVNLITRWAHTWKMMYRIPEILRVAHWRYRHSHDVDFLKPNIHTRNLNTLGMHPVETGKWKVLLLFLDISIVQITNLMKIDFRVENASLK